MIILLNDLLISCTQNNNNKKHTAGQQVLKSTLGGNTFIRMSLYIMFLFFLLGPEVKEAPVIHFLQVTHFIGSFHILGSFHQTSKFRDCGLLYIFHI